MKEPFLTIRCPADLKERIQARAKSDHRKLADESRYLLEMALGKLDAKRKEVPA